jgi:hypothetical protein
VLARIPRERLVGAHRGARAGDLVGRDGGADSGAVNHDSGVDFLARYQPRDLCGDVGIIDRLRPVGADIEHAETAVSQMVAEMRLQRHAGMIAADGQGLDLGDRRQAVKARVGDAAQHRDASGLQRICGERRHMPARLERHGGSDLERPRVGFSDDLERFHPG